MLIVPHCTVLLATWPNIYRAEFDARGRWWGCDLENKPVVLLSFSLNTDKGVILQDIISEGCTCKSQDLMSSNECFLRLKCVFPSAVVLMIVPVNQITDNVCTHSTTNRNTRATVAAPWRGLEQKQKGKLAKHVSSLAENQLALGRLCESRILWPGSWDSMPAHTHRHTYLLIHI